MTDIAFRDATQLATNLADGEFSSVELTQHYIERIERLDNKTNAVVVRCFDEALAAAEAADAARSRGESLGTLHGVPVTIKESYDLVGTPTTWGIDEFANNRAKSDADTVARLKNAGAHFLGKTNVPKQLADFQSYNTIYGQTNNPWQLDRTPGGSSGGSAAALAAGYSALEAGSDIGGSIRNPAHYCGVYGHKPTWGVVSPRGHALPGAAAPPDIAVCGPLARSADDLELAMSICAGPDGAVGEGWRLELATATQQRLSDFRVAIWPSDPIAPVSTAVAERVQQVADVLAKAGATVSDTARPNLDLNAALETYFALLWGVMSAGVPDDMHAQRKAEAADLSPDDDSAAAILLRYSVQDHRDWVKHHHRRYRIRAAWREFFDDWDIVICPQMPTTAFPHDHTKWVDRTIDLDGAAYSYFQQLHWAGLITVAHLPSTIFPTGVAADGLPIGLQAVGKEYDDYLTIRFCQLLSREFGGFEAPPGY